MDTGCLWYDASDRPLSFKLATASRFYTQKYGLVPNLCHVHPSAVEKDGLIDGIMVKRDKMVVKGHLFIGVLDES